MRLRTSWMGYGYIAFTYVMGTFLCLAPWSSLWQHNYFITMLDFNTAGWAGWVRGAISGLGAINLLYALRSIYEIPRRMERG